MNQINEVLSIRENEVKELENQLKIQKLNYTS